VNRVPTISALALLLSGCSLAANRDVQAPGGVSTRFNLPAGRFIQIAQNPATYDCFPKSCEATQSNSSRDFPLTTCLSHRSCRL
jgi:hypothetical protein